jgi:hypothetical protein
MISKIRFNSMGFKIGTVIHVSVVSVILAYGLISCAVQHTLSQGVEGQVRWFQGDLMPGIDKEPVEGVPVKREIYFFRITRTSEAKMHDQVFYNDIQTELIKKIWTDNKGHFRVELKPGSYSVFTKEPQGYFANRFSADGLINPVEVSEGEVTEVMIRIDYAAAY